MILPISKQGDDGEEVKEKKNCHISSPLQVTKMLEEAIFYANWLLGRYVKTKALFTGSSNYFWSAKLNFNKKHLL